MSVKDGKDYLYLVWKENVTRKQYVIGQLTKNGQFEFNYGFQVNEAIGNGFKLLLSFEKLDVVYESPFMFPVFSSRLPDKKRKGIDKILKKYKLVEYDEYKLLKASGAKLPIDNLEFIDPIFGDEDEITRLFYLAGPRHYIGCNGEDCVKSLTISTGDKLLLVFEPENKFDKNAIKIVDQNNNHIGYLPRYFSESVKKALESNYVYKCIAYEVQKDNKCNECIKVELKLTN